MIAIEVLPNIFMVHFSNLVLKELVKNGPIILAEDDKDDPGTGATFKVYSPVLACSKVLRSYSTR